ncbi:TPA: ArsR family transcriptional regulator [Candidatus Woesearchaeota archaeon]|nr:ArsR family transcriptional regulator [Candidatus Woesearchaeota archaeon]HIH12871.1 ArsR family transcriptional regulator [Candidatus Woesearchaeota archaeon]
MSKRIILINIKKQPTDNINQELQWMGTSLGLFNLRDRNSSCFRIFITLIKKAKKNEAISSDYIAEKLTLSRGTVVHHLTKLMEAGIVVREREGYVLRESSLQSLVRDLRQDVETMLSELRDVAQKIDEQLGE